MYEDKWRVPPQVADLETKLAEQTESAEERRAREVLSPAINFIRTIINKEKREEEKCSGSMEITAHLDHIRHRETAPGINWSNRWT